MRRVTKSNQDVISRLGRGAEAAHSLPKWPRSADFLFLTYKYCVESDGHMVAQCLVVQSPGKANAKPRQRLFTSTACQNKNEDDCEITPKMASLDKYRFGVNTNN